ncbi:MULTISPECIES: GNAT family N-acetyltransferase [unclassified Isoptericola]|uniref:GNAT family N-acetyltransferase n=1 Tax=unclassified Isoptericola TaxID=2623355 RepID=UPI003653D31D
MTTSRTPLPPPRLRPATARDGDALERLWALFRHDLSEVTGELPGPDGRFRDERLRAALADLDRCDGARWGAHLATVDDRPVAFALVRGLDTPVRVLSAFFVARAARRHGLGREVATAVLRTVPGPWEIAFQDANAAAAAFWPRVATDVAGEGWSLEHRAVPGRPDLPPDSWVRLDVS